MKLLYTLLFLAILLSTLLSPLLAQAESGQVGTKITETSNTNTEKQINMPNIDLSELDDFWQSIAEEYQGFLPPSQKGSFSDFVFGDKIFSLKEWVVSLGKFAISQMFENGKLIGMLVILSVFAAFLKTLQTSFEQNSVSKVADAVIVMMLLLFAITSFKSCSTYILGAVSAMVDFLMAIIPVILAIMISSGSIASGAFFHPILYFLINSAAFVIQYVVLPLLFFSTVLGLVNELSEQYKISSLANICRSVSMWLLGVMMTAFVTVLSVQSVSLAVADGFGIRTAKYLSGNLIPVVGKMLADATDTVMGASIILKNVIGTVGLIGLFAIIIVPAIKILFIALSYQIAVALIQPLGQSVVVKSLQIISKNMLYMLASYMAVGVLFFLAMTILISSSNITMMVR